MKAMSSYLYWTMASIIWALPLFLAQFHTLLYTSIAHADTGNLTHHSSPFLCRPDPAEALLQLKDSFFSDTSTTRLPSWRDGTDCCLWEGVGCETSSGNVTVLDLNNRGLSSYGLDSAIFNLTSLRRLDLSMNDFSRETFMCFSIPATGFERFTSLTHLNLSYSRLSGQIPIGMGKLVNLCSLDLSCSFQDCYSGFQSNLFGTLVANLSNLRELYLGGVDLSSSGEGWCKALASSVPRLQVLSMPFCRLTGPIDKSLSRLSSLNVINLVRNDAITAGRFPEFIMDFINLTVLQLSDTNLKGWFPSRSFQSKNLRVLDLSGNQNLSGHMPNFCNASYLETLILDGTNFSPAKQMSSSRFKSLKELSLDYNLASVDFLSSLGKLESLRQLNLLGFGSAIELGPYFSWVGAHKTLKSLVLEGCNFSMVLPSSLSHFMTLRSLTMVECNIPTITLCGLGNLMELQTLIMERCTTSGPMPSSIGNLKNLRNLDITYCGFSGSLPAAIGNLTNLKTLRIHNDFFGDVPYEIGKLKKLTSLDLESCNFSGSIPTSIVNLTKLNLLNLRDNSLTGEIPSSIFTLPVFHELDLSYNLLSGPIRDFGNVSSQLEVVMLTHNELTGSFPNSFFRLTSLIELDIRSNSLIGSVGLTSFWRLRRLRELSLSNNKLSIAEGEDVSPLSSSQFGCIRFDLASCNINRFPESLALMKHISFLDLSCNKITGDVPKWIWETWTNSLTYLNLSHNMLTNMQLTSDILPFTNAIYTLDLSFNAFQGRIPMPKSSSLFLDYSNNRFSSVLPNWTSYLTDTEYLSMSNNSINGHIPISICNSTLKVLDLSHNNFSGAIPSCITENAQLGVLSLRKNQFEGMLSSNMTSCGLQTLDLHGNKIEGQLPRGLSNCLQLEVLDFGRNRIVDIFPSWLRGLPRLSVIVLRSNKFYGTIGDDVGDIKYEDFFPSLQILDLASNNFSGNLRPQWIEMLKLMMAKSNNTGLLIADQNPTMILNEIYQDSVEIMYKGSDKTFVKILTTLTAIDFSNNRLEGLLPESIGRLVSLHILDLSHNAFTGRIPAQFGGMTDLESLDLSGNQLSGVIPQELTYLTFLGFLNLSDNHLVGKIPQSRQFLTFGSSSCEGNPGLCGPQLSESPCGASPYTPTGTSEHKSSHHVDVILFLFVGMGYGVGFAAAILVQWGWIGRWISATARALRT